MKKMNPDTTALPPQRTKNREKSDDIDISTPQNLTFYMKDFLSVVGGVSDSSKLNATDTREVKEESVIFESNFDLSKERLRYVFDKFDTDKDDKISYDALMRGLEIQAGLDDFLTEVVFGKLATFLDQDNSGDVSFEEFSEGVRLLMLRALFSSDNLSGRVGAPFEVLDYNIDKLEQTIVAPCRERDPVGKKEEILEERDGFFFNFRPEWVQTRWINVDRASTVTEDSGESTLKKLAAKYTLHPLALEDALSPSIRPKVELFSSHYLIIFPVFSLATNGLAIKRNSSFSAIPSRFLKCNSLFSFNFCGKSSDRNSTDRRPQIAQVNVECVSIFVNTPKYDTIITFNNNGTSQTSDRRDYWDRVKKELAKGYSKLRQYDAQYLTYALLDLAADHLIPILSTMRKEIIREKEYLKKDKYESLSRVYQLQKELEKIRKQIKPFTRLLLNVIEDETIAQDVTMYLRDVYDNLDCIDDDVNELIDECLNLADIAEKFHARRMDRTLYTLTVVSSVFLPAQFLTGVWGMNFFHMPELDDKWMYPIFFWIFTGSMIAVLLIVFNFGKLPNYNIH